MSLTSTSDLAHDPDVLALQPVLQTVSDYPRLVRSVVEYQSAADILKTIKGALAAIEAARVKVTNPLNAALKARNAEARETAAPLLQAEKDIKYAMVAFSDAEDERREREQRAANEAAAKERRRLQAIADEAQRKANEEAAQRRREAEAAAAAGRQAEADRLRASAAKVEERAAAKVEKFEERSHSVVAAVSDAAAPKVTGISIPKVWAFEIVDAKAVPREYLDINEARIRKVVQALKDGTNIPGVRVFEQKRVAAGVA